MYGTLRWIAILSLTFAATAAFMPTATAHDDDCVLTVHVQFVKQHVLCQGHNGEGDGCALSFRILFLHREIFCY